MTNSMFRKGFMLVLLPAITSYSEDCTKVIQLAQGLNLNSTAPSEWSLLQGDCCLSVNIGCDTQTLRVVVITWPSMNLNGIISGSAIPSQLEQLDLSLNFITGSIPSSLPSSLTFINLRGNSLTGPLPSNLPLLTFLNVRGNQLSGPLPVFSATLTSLLLGYSGSPGNQFTGKLVLNSPTTLFINDNLITDISIADTSRLTLCDLSNNPLLGNPNVALLTMCTKNNLFASPDCPNVINLALGLRMDIRQPEIMNQLKSNCCAGASRTILCSANLRVTSISWINLNLDGYINGSSIPPLLRIFSLYDNNIYGTIPSNLPTNLQEMNWHNNSLVGSIPSTLPNSLIYFNVRSNKLTGDLPLFPSTIESIYLGLPGQPTSNHLSGTLILSSPINLKINDNWISEIIIKDISKLAFGSCDLSDNPLLGNPLLENLTMCIANNLYSPTNTISAKLSLFITSKKLTASLKNGNTASSSSTFNLLFSSDSNNSTRNSKTLSIFQLYSTRFLVQTATPKQEKSSNIKDMINTSFELNSNIEQFSDSPEPSKKVAQITKTQDAKKQVSRTSTVQINPANQITFDSISIILYAFAAFMIICILVVIAGCFIKNPKVHSKFGRKNSFATLNTFNSKKSNVKSI